VVKGPRESPGGRRRIDRPAPQEEDDRETNRVAASDSEDAVLSFRIVHGEMVETHPLPAEGCIVVGRGRDTELRIDDPSISRRHAEIQVGPRVWIEDCGSANGTRVGERRLAPRERVELQPGMIIELGNVRAFVQRGAAPGPSAPAARASQGLRRAGSAARHRGGELARLRDLVDRVAPSTIPVLLLGETGVGKEVFANAIHASSPRAGAPFVRLNCAGFSEHLLESELFGHERGSFTGAHQTKAGLLEIARAGTVFLDELGEMPTAVQAKLLRVVEEQSVMRIGALAPRPIDVRFISATNRNLEVDVAEGRFRRDLYFRLNGVLIAIRPLRERTNEIAGLAGEFIEEAARGSKRRAPSLSMEALGALERYNWPGNVRELRNTIERAVLLCTGDVILPEHLPLDRLRSSFPPNLPTPSTDASLPLRDQLSLLERERVLDALARCGGNQTRAAKLLKISRGTLAARLEAFNVARPKKRS
jgi:DNA-binding NtrC family response regulator